MSQLSPADRRRDRIALALVVAGAITALISNLQLRALAAGQGIEHASTRELRNLARADRWSNVGRAGTALVIAGVAVGIWSFVRYASRSAATESHEQEDRSRPE